MSKPDKYPYIDTMQPNVFDAILRAVNELRKERKSESYLAEQRSIALTEKTRRDARELEARQREVARLAAERSAQLFATKSVPTVIQAEDGLILREAARPKFVR